MASSPISHPTYFASTGVSAKLRGDHIFVAFAGGELMLPPHEAKLLSLHCEGAFLEWLSRPDIVTANVIKFPKKLKKRRKRA